MSIVDNVATGLRWAFVAKIVGQAFSWVSTFIVIRLLAPEDYGLVAIASAIVAFGMMVSELGLSAAIIHSDAMPKQRLRQAFTLTAAVCFFFYFVFFAAAGWMSEVYSNPLLERIIPVQSLQLLLSVFIIIPAALLSREMRFKERSFVEMTAGLAGTAATLALALAGVGVWALVVGTLVAHTSRGIIYAFYHQSIYKLTFDFSDFLAFGRYSSFSFLNRFLFYLYVQVDVFLIGKLLSVQTLGVYSVSNSLATLPLNKIGAIFNEVGLSAFSRIKHDISTIRYYFLSATTVVAIATLPMFLGIAAISNDLVLVVLGDKWRAAGFPLMILAFAVPMRTLLVLVNVLLDGIGWPQIGTRNLITACILIPIAVLVGSRYGLNYVCIALVAAYSLHFVLALRRVLPRVSISFAEYLSSLKAPVAASLLMFGAVKGYVQLGPEDVSVAFLLSEVAVGALVYCSFAWLLVPKRDRQMALRLIRRKELKEN